MSVFLHRVDAVAGSGPITAVKDNIDVARMPTTAGCPGMSYLPERDAAAVARLRTWGARIIGKANLDQFATGQVGTRSPYGIPPNPFDTDRVPVGSSSGSAVAMATGACWIALGTDTAGSGRVPAAFNNLVGIKPTRGWISTRGVVPACRSLDCVLVCALNVAEAWEAVQAMVGYDADDVFSRRAQIPCLPHGSLRIGVPMSDPILGIHPDWLAGWSRVIDVLRGLGHQVVGIDFAPFAEAGATLYGVSWVAERTVSVGDIIDRAVEGIDPIVAEIIRGGRHRSAVDAYADLQRMAELRRQAEAQ